MKAAIYLRVSTEGQVKDGNGLERQEEKCRGMASIRDMEVVEVYSDEGISGTLSESDRPALKQMLSDAEDCKFDCVIVENFSRLGRTTLVTLGLVEKITKSCATDLISVDELLDTSSPAGQFVLTMFAAVSQLDHQNIVIKLQDGRKRKKTAVGWAGGVTPFGYETIDGVPAINKQEAKVVRKIFRLLDKGYSINGVAKELNEKMLSTRSVGKWYASSVSRVVDNKPKYRGGKINNSAANWPRII